MRMIYNKNDESNEMSSITFYNRHLSFGTDYRGKVEHRVLKSDGYNSFRADISLPLWIPLFDYKKITLYITLLDNLPTTVSVFDDDRILGSLVMGVSTPIVYDCRVYGRRNTTNNLEVYFHDANVSAGIIVDKICFETVGSMGAIPPLNANVETDIMLGSGIKEASMPLLQSYYIDGSMTLKGNSVAGALMKIHNNTGRGIIIPTQPSGRYLHYTKTNCPMTLVAYSQWYNHNSMIREDVRPNRNIRTQIGSFIFSLDYSDYTQFLTGYAIEEDYIRFKRIGASQSTNIMVKSFQTDKILLLECNMETEQRYDWFKVYDASGTELYRLSGSMIKHIAVDSGYRLEYSKDSSNDTGFDTVKFMSGKVVSKSKSIATMRGYVDYDGSVNPGGSHENMISDYIKIEPSKVIEYRSWVSNPTEIETSWAFYDAEKKIIGRIGEVENTTGKITPPSNAVFIRIGGKYLQHGYIEIA